MREDFSVLYDKDFVGKKLGASIFEDFFYVNIFNNFKSLLILLQCCFCIMFLGFFLP